VKRNVFIFPGGTEIGLEINKSLRHCIEVQLFSAGLSVSNHAPYVIQSMVVSVGIDNALIMEAQG
jgi:carbamoyl-phosphate synthase large subunit